jgi:GntR family transcriptional regulator
MTTSETLQPTEEEQELDIGENLSPCSPVPLYTQIRELLRERILSGLYKSHAQIPSENDMVRMFSVSRITVRQALTDLQKEGLIFKIHGKGTFVSKPKATQNLGRLEGFGEAMSGAGHETFSRVLGHSVHRAGKLVADRLRMSERDDIMEITRVRYLDREPISLDVTYVPLPIGYRLIREDLARRDIFLILENDYGIALGNAELCIESVIADEDLATALKIEEGSAILRIERLTCTADGQPLDFEFLYYRGDAFQYRLRIERRATSYRRYTEQMK